MHIRVQGSTDVPNKDTDGNIIGTVEKRVSGIAIRNTKATEKEVMDTALRLISTLGLKADEITVSVVTRETKGTINGVLILNEELDRYSVNPSSNSLKGFLGTSEPVKKITEIDVLKTRT